MDTLFRKYFFVVEMLFLALAAFLVAGIGSSVVESKLRVLPEIPNKDNTAKGAAAKPVQTATIEDVKKANIFKTPRSEPVKLDTSTDDSDQGPASNEPVLSQIRFTLVGTIVSDDPRWSFALMVDNGTKANDLFGMGQKIADEYKIINIQRKRVTFQHGNRVEYLDLDEDPNAAKKPAVAGKKDEGGGAEGVKEVSPGKYIVAQSELDSTLTNLNQVAMQARIVPNFDGGKANGFKMFQIKPGSIYSKIGLQNEDVITKINGFEMNSPDKALEIYGKLKDTKHITVDVMRRGKPMNMDYSIR